MSFHDDIRDCLDNGGEIDLSNYLMDDGSFNEYMFEPVCLEYARWLDRGVLPERVIWVKLDSAVGDKYINLIHQNLIDWIGMFLYDDWIEFSKSIEGGTWRPREVTKSVYENNNEFREKIHESTIIIGDDQSQIGYYNDVVDEQEDDGEQENGKNMIYGKVQEAGIVDEDMDIDFQKLRGACLKFARDVDKITGQEEDLNRDDLRSAFNKWMLDRLGKDWSKFISDRLSPGDLMDVVLYMYKNNDEFNQLVNEKYEYDSSVISGNSREKTRRKKQRISEWDSEAINEGQVRDEDEDPFGLDSDEEVDIDVSANSVYNCSCMDVVDNMEDNFLDALITDPPYGQDYDSRGDDHDVIEGDDTLSGALDITESIIKECRMKLKDGSPVIMFAGDSNLCGVKRIISKWFDYKQTIIWDKEWIGSSGIYDNAVRFRKEHEYIVFGYYGSPKFENENRHDGSIISFQRPSGDNRVHPTEKPIDLMDYIIDSFTQEGDLVFDPFAGSGSTLVAARSSGRDYIGSELDEEYYNAIQDRLSQNTIGDWA